MPNEQANRVITKRCLKTVITRGGDGRYGWAVVDTTKNIVLAASPVECFDSEKHALDALSAVRSAMMIELAADVYHWGKRLAGEEDYIKETVETAEEPTVVPPLEATAPPTVVEGGTLDLRAQLG